MLASASKASRRSSETKSRTTTNPFAWYSSRSRAISSAENAEAAAAAEAAAEFAANEERARLNPVGTGKIILETERGGRERITLLLLIDTIDRLRGSDGKSLCCDLGGRDSRNAVNLPARGMAAGAEARVAETRMDKRSTTHGSLLILGRVRFKEVGREFGERGRRPAWVGPGEPYAILTRRG